MGLPSLYLCLFILDGQGRAGDKMMGEHKQHSGYGGVFQVEEAYTQGVRQRMAERTVQN